MTGLKDRDGPPGVALISAPWPLFNRPSIQLGTLKAWLRLRFPSLNIEAFHLYLRVADSVGYPLYHEISHRTWIAEAVYGALLYPDRREAIETLFFRSLPGRLKRIRPDFDAIVRNVALETDAFLAETEWNRYGLAGFSICLCQLTASLYLIKRVKRVFPELPVVVGGSVVSGDATARLLSAFPEIDYVVHGEGEKPLAALVDALLLGSGRSAPERIDGVMTARREGRGEPFSFSQLDDLENLPIPDYDDYMEMIDRLSPQKRFFPTLPAEVSRGCWWQRPRTGKPGRGCAFCNLNLQWDGYRTKEAAQVVGEIDRLTSRHRTLSVAFTDNLLPLRGSENIFSRLADGGKDLRLFGEIRAATPKTVLRTMRKAGLIEVQIGIEALSSRLLRKMGKGTTAMENLEAMKHCEALGIRNFSNLILNFPGSDAADVEETLRTLEFAGSFRPLKAVSFWLGRGSPVCRDPRRYGIRVVSNHPNYRILFPPEIVSAVRFTLQAYRGDLGRQRRLWAPVKRGLAQWKRSYSSLRRETEGEPILSYRDGREFLIIRRNRVGAEPETHRLVGSSREIFLFCDRARSAKRIGLRFRRLPEDRIREFLDMMVEKRLMFREGDRYLSLAVPAGGDRNEFCNLPTGTR